ncbi:MAG: glycosyltransferase family 39 protein [Planctomycetes bacterium]|nr:glycosyltransferase family 39 protein [Planctomycetota bacterium]
MDPATAPVAAGRPSARHPVVLAALVALILAAAGLRWVALDAGLPHVREADAAMVHFAAFHARPPGAPVTEAVYPSRVYPQFLGRLLGVLPGSSYAEEAPPGAQLGAHQAAAAEPYWRARLLIALLSLLAIPFTYLFARNWLEPGWSLFAACLPATSMNFLEVSVVAKPHGALAGLAAVALWAIVRLVREAGWRAYLAAGTATGAALATLNSGAFLLPALGLAHVLGWRSDRVRARWARVGLAVALCGGFFLLGYAYLFAPRPEAERVAGALQFGENAIYWHTWGLGNIRNVAPRLFAFEPVLTILAGVALTWLTLKLAFDPGARRAARRPEVLVVALYFVIWLILFGLHERFFPRYALPVLPVLCVLAAHPLRALARALAARVRAPVASQLVAPALALFALVYPARATWQAAWIRAVPDTYEQAAAWIEEHLDPAHGPVAVDMTLGLPLVARRESLAAWPSWSLQPWQRYQLEILTRELPGPAWDLRPIHFRGIQHDRRIDAGEIDQVLALVRPRYVVVSVPDPDSATRDATREAVRARCGPPLASFSPLRAGRAEAAFRTRDFHLDHLAHVLASARLGPPIEVYAVP